MVKKKKAKEKSMTVIAVEEKICIIFSFLCVLRMGVQGCCYFFVFAAEHAASFRHFHG